MTFFTSHFRDEKRRFWLHVCPTCYLWNDFKARKVSNWNTIIFSRRFVTLEKTGLNAKIAALKMHLEIRFNQTIRGNEEIIPKISCFSCFEIRPSSVRPINRFSSISPFENRIEIVKIEKLCSVSCFTDYLIDFHIEINRTKSNRKIPKKCA